jgi:hypothetical protein
LSSIASASSFLSLAFSSSTTNAGS